MMFPNPQKPIEDQDEPVLLRMAAWAEARGEGPVGQLAVMCFIGNRAAKSGKGLKHEILKPLQFSAFNQNDPNRKKMLLAHDLSPAGWAQIDAVATLYEAGVTKDPTEGSTHYYAHASVNPAWGPRDSRWKLKAVIGGHTFGNAA
jgi:spore germination cell wall hydrolase CwlJ-like protein